MLRLTLRSSRDGRFLARIIDRGGFPFVLDFGDPRIIEDVSQRILHGFTMWRHGRLVSASPQDPTILRLLAEFYSGEGLLVFLDEPNWAGRGGGSGERLDGPPSMVGVLLEEVRREQAPVDGTEDANPVENEAMDDSDEDVIEDGVTELVDTDTRGDLVVAAPLRTQANLDPFGLPPVEDEEPETDWTVPPDLLPEEAGEA